MKWLYRISFYHRIQLSLLLFLIIPILFITTLSYYSNKSATEDNIRASMVGLLGVLANDIEKTINDVTYTFNGISIPQQSNAELYKKISELNNINQFHDFQAYSDYVWLNEEMMKLLGRLSLLNIEMLLINENEFPIIGKYNSQQVQQLLVDHRFLPMSNPEVESGHIKWFTKKLDNVDGINAKEVLVAKKTVYNYTQQQRLGTLFIFVPMTYFTQLYQNIDMGYISIYDEQGQLINDMDHPQANKGGEGWIREETSLQGTGWKIIYEIEESTVTGYMFQRFYYLLIGILLIVFLFLFVLVVISKGLNSPIQKLTRVVKHYGEGNTSIRYHVQSQDEISMLGVSVNRMMDNINGLMVKVATEQEEKRLIELQALYAQIQPHFLLNTLNSIRCNLLLKGDHEHSSIIDSLMSMLRAYLKVSEVHTIHDECTLLEQYVAIMRLRNRRDIRLILSVGHDTEAVFIPRLLLQPIVENSIVHSSSHSSLLIFVDIWLDSDGLYCVLEDNGGGLTEEKLNNIRSKMSGDTYSSKEQQGIGIYNVVKRVVLSYGSEASIHFYTNDQQGLGCKLFIPKSELRREVM